LHTFQIQSGLTVPSLKHPFWFRRSLHQKFSKATTAETDAGSCSTGGASAVDHTLKIGGSSLGPPSDSSTASASAPPHVEPPILKGKKGKAKTVESAESLAGAPAAAAGGVTTMKSKTPITMNKAQTHGAIFLPLRLRANGMPLLIVNTHLNCKTFDLFFAFVLSINGQFTTFAFPDRLLCYTLLHIEFAFRQSSDFSLLAQAGSRIQRFSWPRHPFS
jgi:hypothetical protein